MERLLHAKLLSGGFESEEWYTDAKEQHVCDFAACYDEDSGEIGFGDDCCYGHFEFDRLLDAASGDRNKFFGPTNAETLAASDARSIKYSMPYMYDHFKWEHCEEDFDTALTDMYEEASSSEER